MRVRRRFGAAVLGALAVLLLGGVERADAAMIVGPTLSLNEGGHAYHGIDFTALTNSTLTGFLVGNQRRAETVQLQAPVVGGTVFDSLLVPAGNPSFAASGLNWSLTAGADYWLVETTPSDGRYAAFAGFPVSDADLRVNSGVFDGDTTAFWGDFNNIATTAPAASAVPEPTSLTLLTAGALGLLGYRWRRRMSGRTA
jgi:hypothetical protein